MQELTILLFGACLMCGAAAMLMKKPGPGAWVLSLVLSVLSLGAVLTDESVITSEGYDLVLMIVAPFTIFIYSVYGMLFGGKSRWREGDRPPIC